LNIVINEGHDEVEVIINCPKITDEVLKIESLCKGLKNQERLSCAQNGKTYLIDRRDIFYFESVDKRCFLYTANDVYEISMKLYEIEEMFENEGFIRSSKSQILNVSKIKSICPDFGGRIEAMMENNEKIIISRQYSKILKERLGI